MRLFITRLEQNLISDITKEFLKDISGQFIIYYPISTLKTQVHPVYDEAIEKIFENPIKIDALVSNEKWESRFNQFGNEQFATIEIFIHPKDMIDKGYDISEGDFFLYGDILYEVQTYIQIGNIYGQVEYNQGFKVTAKTIRQGQFDVNVFKQILINNHPEFAESNVQKIFQQQRGLPENIDGPTGDRRDLKEQFGEDWAEKELLEQEGPRIININQDEKASSFDHDTPNHTDISKIYNED